MQTPQGQGFEQRGDISSANFFNLILAPVFGVIGNEQQADVLLGNGVISPSRATVLRSRAT